MKCKCISLLHNIIIDFEGYCSLHSRLSQHDSLSLTPTRATTKQRTNKPGRCYQPERPFCTLTRYTLRRRTAPFTSTQVSGRETRVHAGRWHKGHSLRRKPAGTRLLGRQFRIPPEARMSVSCECCVLSGRGSCDRPNPRPEKTYRMCICVSLSVIRCNRNPLYLQ